MFNRWKLNRQNWQTLKDRFSAKEQAVPIDDFITDDGAGSGYHNFEAGSSSWRHLLDEISWDEAPNNIDSDCRARIVVLGQPGCGKSTLLNRWCGWTVSAPTIKGQESIPCEDFGLFCLVDTAGQPKPFSLTPFDATAAKSINGENGDVWSETDYYHEYSFEPDYLDPMSLAESADLLVYVIDGARGLETSDYRWVGKLRQLGTPLMIVLNKIDLIEADQVQQQAVIEARLASSVWPTSALNDSESKVDELLLKMMNQSPKLTVALGRSFPRLRSTAAERLIKQAAWINGLVALQPVPFLDMPIQLSILSRLILQIAAIYNRSVAAVRRREVVTAIVGGLAARFGAQQLAKLVPVLGWLISGVLGWSATWLLGRAAMGYFEVEVDTALVRRWDQTKAGVGQAYRSVGKAWQQRPRLKIEWQRPGTQSKSEAKKTEEEDADVQIFDD